MSAHDPHGGMALPTDWDEWHRLYDDPHSDPSRRLVLIQSAITTWLDATAPKRVRLLSVCSGDRRDVIEVLRDRPDAARVRATLLEQDSRDAQRARDAFRPLSRAPFGHRAGVRRWAVRSVGRAGPVDLVLLAGVFGNISDGDVKATIDALPWVCAPGAVVVWTRHRRAPISRGGFGRGWGCRIRRGVVRRAVRRDLQRRRQPLSPAHHPCGRPTRDPLQLHPLSRTQNSTCRRPNHTMRGHKHERST